MTNWQKPLRFLWISLALSAILAAQPSVEHYDTQNRRIFELLADSMELNGEIIEGSGNILVVSSGYYANADFAYYNTTTREILLEGNVHVFQGESLYMRAQKVRLQLDENFALLAPLYLQETTTGIWITAQEAEMRKTSYELRNSTFSSCSIELPIWGIAFSSGNYNTEDSWLSLWNARLYAYKYPVFYLPYFAFSLDQKRKTGFLFPRLKTSRNDGFVYNQPFFYAIDERQDATITTMMRSKRGYGAELEYRYADDTNQILKLNLGYFGVKESYQKQYDLANTKYKGFQLLYTRYNLFEILPSHFHENGFYIDWSNINDVDYLHIREHDSIDVDIYDSLLTSRINFFLNGANDYFGAYVRYQIDLAQISNQDTAQILPSLQYHRYTAPFFWDKVTYNIDFRTNNYTSRSGYSIVQNEIYLPIAFTQSLFQDYLFFKVATEFQAVRADFYRRDSRPNELTPGTVFANEYRVAFYSDLARPYSDFLHSLHLEADYKLNGFLHQSGNDVFEIEGDYNALGLKAQQYFHFNNGMQIAHKIAQPIYTHGNATTYGDFEHEMSLIPNDNWTLTSSFFYSPSKRKIAEISHDVSYTDEQIAIYAGHFRRRAYMRFLEQTWDWNAANFIHAGINKRFEWFDLFGSIGYDYDRQYFRTWNVGIHKAIRCFSYRVRLASEVRPLLTSSGVRPQEEKYIMFEVGLLPLVTLPLKISVEGL